MNYFFISFMAFLLSCGPREISRQGLDQDVTPLKFEKDSLIREQCADESCAQIRLVWPVAKGGDQADMINSQIRETVKNLMQYGEKDSPDLEAGVDQFFEEFLSFRSEFPESAQEWEIQVEGEVSYSSDQTLSIFFSQYTYLGGAHPNSMVYFLNLDYTSGKALESNQLVLNEKELLKLTEHKFREYHEVEEGVSLEESGKFFLPETGFFLANAMGFQEDRFKVIYIPYEIGSYAMGYTELEFSREELKEIVRW
ncbi:DUF4163 domain-containing protein [Algoriphagus confluentis]|uniref:DUF3298/DUF4163 domain-containing protein n=1 Tax=Algoriphagus confluentis TaxID=1697556 RepID=A0ABQ6PMM1_9BACT|nr:hypothetical protein Aconfl_18570 [Algoriphagus confluentis]